MSTHVVYKIVDPRVPIGKYSRVIGCYTPANKNKENV